MTVHRTGVPWDDKSGERLRDWLGVERAVFYDASQIALMPMGYCYPGRGSSGDLPPCKECAEHWHHRLLEQMNQIDLILLIGQYAQRYFLGKASRGKRHRDRRGVCDYAPRYVPLPHPSPRNTGWFQHHPWFEHEVLPALREQVHRVLTPQPQQK